MYLFDEQLKQGKRGEYLLDEFFGAQGYKVQHASKRADRQGIDRYLIRTVEYKTDYMAHKTGNLFVETISVKNATTEKPGWAHTSKADWLIWLIDGKSEVLIIWFGTLRRMLPEWEKRCREVSVQNKGYLTIGRLVPLDEMRQLAGKVYVLDT